MKELKVYPCANGSLVKAAYDERDNTIVLFNHGLALGYLKLDEVKEDDRRKRKKVQRAEERKDS